MSWPARAYICGTWGYAQYFAREISIEFSARHKMYVYQSRLDDETVWVVAFDPKPRRRKKIPKNPLEGPSKVAI